MTASQQFFSQIVISTSIKAIIFVAGTKMYWIVKMVNCHQNVLQILTGQYKKKWKQKKKVRDQLFDLKNYLGYVRRLRLLIVILFLCHCFCVLI